MGRFAKVYSDEQKQAIIRVIVDEKMSAPDACRIAAEHGLAGLDPWTMNLHYARELARDERRKRRGQILSPLARRPPREAFETLLRRLLSLIEQRLEAEEKKGAKCEEKALQSLATTMSRTYELLAKLTGERTEPKTYGTRLKSKAELVEQASAEQQGPFIQSLEKEHRATGNGVTVDPTGETAESAEAGEAEEVGAGGGARSYSEGLRDQGPELPTVLAG